MTNFGIIYVRASNHHLFSSGFQANRVVRQHFNFQCNNLFLYIERRNRKWKEKGKKKCVTLLYANTRQWKRSLSDSRFLPKFTVDLEAFCGKMLHRPGEKRVTLGVRWNRVTKIKVKRKAVVQKKGRFKHAGNDRFMRDYGSNKNYMNMTVQNVGPKNANCFQ